MKRFNTGIWLAGLVASGVAMVPMACGPVENEAGREAAPDAPQLAVQVQESYGGNLGSALGRPLVTSTTVGKTNEVSSNCGGTNTAPDLTFTWTPPSAGTFKFTTEGSTLDTVLTVHPVNNSTSAWCNDDLDYDAGILWSSLTLPLTFGVGYTIVVDGLGKAVGPITLNITKPGDPCGGGCATPPSTCHQSTGTCDEGLCTYAFKAFGDSCNDGKSCTMGEICDGAGTCGAGTVACNAPPQCHQAPGSCAANGGCSYEPKPAGSTCDDGNACTVNDVCSSAGTCSGTAQCNINGTCYPNGVTNPANTCQVCNTALSTTSWSSKGANTACNDGNACTEGDMCTSSGACAGTPKVCTQSSNACEETTGQCLNGECQFQPMPQNTPCNDGITCTSGDVCNGAKQCIGTVQCSINGACYANGTTNPSNQCQVCNTALSTSSWSNKGAGVVCDDGNACSTNDVCNGSGTCSGSAACSINGACYANGQRNPSNSCLVCDTSRSTTSWSTNDGYVVSTGVCRFGSCNSGACLGSYCDVNEQCWKTCVGSQAICGGGGGIE